ncbi:MAG: hypothetical protein LBL28_03035 [Treponema sp.]|jgi:phosphatidylethanolamine-binding protein (PEBP) family uncharacterized protein|nr:hypothetical protein [Treponema sp.]
MKKNLFGIVALLTVLPATSLVLPGCDTGTAGGITVPVFTVTSLSINSTTGKLLTATASAKGSNQSPQLSWDAVPDAACYAIFMVDESAGHWLHWRAIIANKTNLSQGELSGAEYIGPYPPSGDDDHNYRIEVFALKQAPEAPIGIFDDENNYANMVNQLNAVGGGDNIIARGHIIGKYKNGDNNN